MQALVFKDEPGGKGQLTLESAWPRPTPADDEALVRVLRAGICSTVSAGL